MALAAVGCSSAAPSDDAPGVTPLALAAGWFDRAAVVLRVPRFCAGLGRATRLGGLASGGVIITGGSSPAPDSVLAVCASAGETITMLDIPASHRPQEILRKADASAR